MFKTNKKENIKSIKSLFVVLSSSKQIQLVDVHFVVDSNKHTVILPVSVVA